MQILFLRKLECLSSRITSIKSEVSLTLKKNIVELKAVNLKLDTQLRIAASRQDELDNHSRRPHLIIYSLADIASEN